MPSPRRPSRRRNTWGRWPPPGVPGSLRSSTWPSRRSARCVAAGLVKAAGTRCAAGAGAACRDWLPRGVMSVGWPSVSSRPAMRPRPRWRRHVCAAARVGAARPRSRMRARPHDTRIPCARPSARSSLPVAARSPRRSPISSSRWGRRVWPWRRLICSSPCRCIADASGNGASTRPLLLARRLSRGWNVPVRADVLTRAAATRPQTDLTAAERRANVRGAFALRRPDLVTGRHVIVVDDILTTGSTASACALRLREAGAAVVGVITVARAG